MQGTNLGPYEILEQLGAGGMGEVWLAQDTRLGRQVAVKVLPEEFAGDPERLARFEQEARAAAALNHPNIAVVHDVGNEGSVHYMVQEHLQGETLRDLLEREDPDLKQSLGLALEIAEALKAAHRAGIVHRDLKPENVFVTDDGHAKILDFGLAKLTEVAAGPLSSQTMSPTVLGTQAGAIMGTAGYMAPEQVRGEEVDGRADVFAFGSLLWEMATGQRAFAGKSVPHTLHRILDEPPEGHDSVAGAALPLRLRWLLDRMLAKSPEERAQSAGDVLAELRQIASDVESGAAVTGASRGAAGASAPATEGIPMKTAAPAALAILLAGAALAWLLTPTPTAVAAGPVRFSIDAPDDFTSTSQQVLAISPDGQRLAFVASERLWLRSLDDTEPVALRGTDDPRSPSFSPDGEQIAFWAEHQIKRVPVSGGIPVVVGPSPGRPYGVTWADDGFIYVGSSDSAAIVRLAETGGHPEIVVEADEAGARAYGPRLLPGGEWLLFTIEQRRNWDSARIVAQSLETGERRVLVEGGHDARYVSTGHLLYATGGVLLAVRMDPDSLAVSGGPVPLLDGVRGAAGGNSGAAFYGVASNGSLAYIPGFRGNADGVQLAWVDHAGAVELLPVEPTAFDAFLSLSPRGDQFAAQVEESEGSQIWIYNVDRPGGQRLTTGGENGSPIWGPEGEWVYFSSQRDADFDIWRRRADHGGAAEPVVEASGRLIPSSISQDGRWLYYSRSEDQADIYRIDLEDPGEPEPVVVTVAGEYNGRISPDGTVLTFVSNETGGTELFAVEVASGSRWRLSTDGGNVAAWSPDGDRILYSTRVGLWEVTITREPVFRPAPARLLRPNPTGSMRTWMTLTPDFERRLVRLRPDARAAEDVASRIDVVLNWFTELVERAPHDR